MSEPVETIAYGATAALVLVGSAREAAEVAGRLRARLDADEVVPGAASVLVEGVSVDAVRAALSGASSPAGEDPVAGSVDLRVVFDGPDLPFVAASWGVSVPEAVARLTSLDLVSAFCGFSPGFAYLAGMPQEWAVPRLESPRPRVAPGAVAIGGPWCGVYPSASPGGWRVVGRSDAVLWDATQPEPALLAPGTRVRFVEAAP